MILRAFFGLMLFASSFLSFGQHWETLVDGKSSFQYFEASGPVTGDWMQTAFDASSWSTGQGGFGYADGDDNTEIIVEYSLYLRKEFNVLDVSVLESVLLDIDYDDGYIAYLNGQEIARSFNLTVNPVPYNPTLSIDKEAVLYTGGQPERTEFSVNDYLVNGTNVLAIQVINVDPESSDFSAIPYLNVQVSTPDLIYGNVPSWFMPPAEAVAFTSSNLPIMIIETTGSAGITREARLDANMKIVDNTVGRNAVDGPFDGYDGLISIKGRGSSSWENFDKKGYSFETRLPTGENNNVSLLGMPAENDWVLHGPFADKTLMKNAFVYDIGTALGRYAPRTHFCELLLNGEYRGVYLLVEKVKRDVNRLDISTLNPSEISGDDLTGGYILSVDRADDVFWSPLIDFNGGFSVYNYVSPDPALMPQVQKDYIRNYVTDFENSLLQQPFEDTENGYRSYINLPSFIDYFIINELTKNIDAYRLSAYFYKDKDSKGGKLTMGPLWDYNLSCGGVNIGFGDWGATAENWIYEEYNGQPFWWQTFLDDGYYTSCLKQRWLDLRENTINEAHFNAIIDEYAALLDEAKDRNFEVFPLGTPVWGNNHSDFSYQEEVDTLKGFLRERIQWMDAEIASLPGNVDCNESFEFVTVLAANPDLGETVVYPIPAENEIHIRFQDSFSSEVSFVIRDLSGKLIQRTNFRLSSGANDMTIDLSDISVSGVFLFTLESQGRIVDKGRFYKK